MKVRVVSLAVGMLLFASVAGLAQSVPPRFSFDWAAMAEKLVERLALEPGETVLAVAHPGLFEELIPHFRYQVMRAGGIDLGVMSVLEEPVPAAFAEDVLRRGGREARRELTGLLERIDASVMLPGAVPGQPVYAAIQDILRDGKGRTIHFHWIENGSAIALPGQPLPPRHEIDALYQKVLLETDYEALGRHQRRFAEAMRAGEVRVTSPSGTDLRFRIGDRPVNFQDGDASAARTARGVVLIDREIELPAGAIRVAPIESSVSGTVVFPPSQWNGRPVTGLTLVFEAGKVVSVSAASPSGQAAAEAEMDAAGEAGRSFREFALGFNPLLAVPDEAPWIPYYGYGAGVVRLSLGDNSELGGNVTGGYVRWNFFVDTTVAIDGDAWVVHGRLVK